MRLARIFVMSAVMGRGLLAAQAPVAVPVMPVVWPGAETALGQQIAAMVMEPAVSHAHWGVAVTAMDGSPIFGLNQGQFFRPASNTKMFTTSAAMALLQPEDAPMGGTMTYPPATRVVGALDAASGVVKGDLTLVGGGDANFDSNDLPYIAPANRPKNVGPMPNPLHDINELADQLAAKGVRKVTGDIVGDDTLFPWEPYAESWSVDDLVWGYGAPVSALTIADNQLRLTITPGKIIHAPGRVTELPGTVALEQNGVPYYTVQAEVAPLPAKSTGGGVDVERLPGSRILRVHGSLAEDAKPDVEEIAIDDPAAYAAMALRMALEKRGIVVQGTTRPKHQPVREGAGFLTQLRAPRGAEEMAVAGGGAGGDCFLPLRPQTLATHKGPALRDDVMLTMKVSQNLHAEILLHQLGRRVFCGPGSTVAGARMVRAFLLHAGLDGGDFVFFDGSGLSDHDLVAPRATAQLLRFAATQPWFAEWKSTLPVGGEDGTMASRFPKAPLKDHVFAKTGTLGEARALSGYLDCASGKTVIFSVMVDTHLPGSADQVVMDRIVAAIAAAN